MTEQERKEYWEKLVREGAKFSKEFPPLTYEEAKTAWYYQLNKLQALQEVYEWNKRKVCWDDDCCLQSFWTCSGCGEEEREGHKDWCVWIIGSLHSNDEVIRQENEPNTIIYRIR